MNRPSLPAIALALALSPLAQADTLVRTSGYVYEATTGFIQKEITEPGTPTLGVATVYTPDNYGNRTAPTTRNCNGSTGEAPAVVVLNVVPDGDPLFASRTSSSAYDTN